MPDVTMPRAKVALVTGASSGIGRALAGELAGRGMRVAIAARRGDALESLAREISSRGGQALPIVVDVRDPDAVRAMVQRVDAELGSLDLVVANAGVGTTGHASTMQWADIDQVLAVNVRGAMATLCAAIPIMVAQQRGHLVGVSSLAGGRGLPTSAAYSASKAALSTFLESLRVDLAPSGIHVTDVRPGFVATEATRSADHPMPFLWPVDRAARHIARRLASEPAVVAFPWPLALLTSFSRFLPTWTYDPLVRAMRH